MRSEVLVTLGPPVGIWYLGGPRLVLALDPCNRPPQAELLTWPDFDAFPHPFNSQKEVWHFP